MSIVDIYGKGVKVLVRDDNTIDADITGSGDFKLVDSKTNLKTRATTRLSVKRGELEIAPDVGSDMFKMVGLPATQLTFEWIKILAYDSLIRDPVIKEVENLTVVKDDKEKGKIHIIGNIVPITEYKQVVDEPHDYVEGQDLYDLNHDHVRIIVEVKGIVNENLYYFIQNEDFIQNGDSVEFISDIKPNGGFLVTYQFYDVQESKEEYIPFHAPFNLSQG